MSALSRNGGILVTWSYTHTGGLPLTSLNITYTYTNGLVMVQRVGLEKQDHTLPSLVAGQTYSVSVTAANRIGDATSQCEPVQHLIGKFSLTYTHM